MWRLYVPAALASVAGLSVAASGIASIVPAAKGPAAAVAQPPAPAAGLPKVEAPPTPPASLQAAVEALAESYREPVGIAVADVDAGWVAAAQEGMFPQQSVSKLWVAVSVLDAVDQGRLALDQTVMLYPQDRSVFFQPIAQHIRAEGYATTVRDLLRRAITESDNAANDRLIRELGGVDRVTAVLAAKGVDGVRLGADERNLQARIAGMTWRPEYGVGMAFKNARAALPAEHRDAAMAAYLDDPYDGASPSAIVRALARLHRGELLSAASTQVMLELMGQTRTGPRRLLAGLPQGWTFAHKTGTGQDLRGASVGINDVGLATGPDGRTYAIAVMMRRTEKPVPARLAFMQRVSRAVADWNDDAAAAAVQTASYDR